MNNFLHFFLITFGFTGCFCGNPKGNYFVGVGIADITGPVAGAHLMGFANPTQTAEGLHIRLYSRAFLFQSDINSAPVIFVSADIHSIDQAVKFQVIEKLQEKYGMNVFSEKNVLLSATHTHSGPGGFHQYFLYGITTFGFNSANFNKIVTGIVKSIENAFNSRQLGKFFINRGKVIGANVNRSPAAYLKNPEWERKLYRNEGSDQEMNVDENMIFLRIEGENDNPLGSINWFGVHPTSMNSTNKLVSGDNKGYASQLFENKMNLDSKNDRFVAAFASSSLGDVSPNTKGEKCIDTGQNCLEDGSCPSDTFFTKHCIAFGEGGNMEESTKINGERQFEAAWKLFNEDRDNIMEQLNGPINFVHQFVDITNYKLEERGNVNVSKSCVDKKPCKAALGFSFGAGTTDGPGIFNFKQGDTSPSHWFWDFVLKMGRMSPSEEMVKCQAPKPVLLPVGEVYFPYDWVGNIVETQILQIGNLFILGIPGELTTMAGRRLIRTVEEIITKKMSGITPHVLVAGLSNVYSQYVTTWEEYQVQRYEGASTLYGPCTLDAYLLQYSYLVGNLLDGKNVSSGPIPQNLLDKQWSLSFPVFMDSKPFGDYFGEVISQPKEVVNPGEIVTATFVGGHPKHGAMPSETFSHVERNIGAMGDSKWIVVATDADWNTKLRWSRPSFLSMGSNIEISWNVPEDVEPGFYRIVSFGRYKKSIFNDKVTNYKGITKVFKIVKKM